MTKIFVINLDRRRDRMEKMSRQLDGLGLRFTRVAAYDADCAVAAAAELDWRVPSLSPGEVGCALSHRVCWLSFLQTGDRHGIVLEDDLIISPRLASLLEEKPFQDLDADVIRLETFRMRIVITRRPATRWRSFGFHRQHTAHWGAGAYILRREFAERLVTEDYNRDLPLDNLLFNPKSDLFETAKIYQMVPALCVQEKRFRPYKGSSDSDLLAGRAVVRRVTDSGASSPFWSRDGMGKQLAKVRDKLGLSEFKSTKVLYDEKRLYQLLTGTKVLEKG